MLNKLILRIVWDAEGRINFFKMAAVMVKKV